jgi:hypothetical protein
MSKVFRRPMFRKGGGANMNGIMSGIQDRQNYAVGTSDVEAAEFGFGQMGQGARSAEELGYDFDFAVPTFKQGPNKSLQDLKEQYSASLLEAAGDRGGYDPLTTFLLQYGPALANKTGGGSLIGNVVGAAEKPLQAMIREKAAEDKFKRGIRLQATGKAIETKEAQDKAAMEIENKLEIAKADVLNKGKELANKIYANKELTKLERENLLTQLANNRQLALEKLRIQSDNAKELLQMELDADDEDNEFVKSEDLFKDYNSRVASDNRAAYENSKLETKAMETFGTAFKGGEEAFIGSIHGYGEGILNTNQVPAAWKKNNEGNIFYDVTDGNFKQLRKNKDKTYSYKKLDINNYSPEEENNIEGGPEKKSTSLSREDAEAYAAEKGLILIGERPKNAGRNWLNNEKKRIGENAVSMEDIKDMMRKDKMDSLYGNIRKKQR